MLTYARPSSNNTVLVEFFEELANDLDPLYGCGEVTPSAYDTAWVALVRLPDNPDKLAFPEALSWLLQNQATNGSWGDLYPYTLLPTLAALLALMRAPEQDEQVRKAVYQAKAYMEGALANWSVENHESIGFEVLAPGLLVELEEEKVVFNFPGREALLKLYGEKLAVVGMEKLCSSGSNLIYSAEAFGKNLDWAGAKQFQLVAGGYCCSPTVTAAALIYGSSWDAKAYEWLQNLITRHNGAVPSVYPIDTFEVSWSLYNFGQSGFKLASYPFLQARLLDWLTASMTSYGAGSNRELVLPPDSDDTAVVLLTLRHYGLNLPYTALEAFERETHFACFQTERSPSLSANAHVLEFLLSLSATEKNRLSASITKTSKFLLENRTSEGYWQDKWHLSPYYATACSTLALAKHPSNRALNLLQPTIDWLLQTQQLNGGWGCGNAPTLEETAYALQSLKACLHFYCSKKLELAISRGQSYLRDGLRQPEIIYPKLWRGKELYTPVRVVKSAVLSALL